MRIKKNHNSYIGTFILLAMVLYMCCNVNCRGIEYNQNRLIALSQENKLHYYDPVIDSFKKNEFYANYKSIIDSLETIKGEIEVIGSRTRTIRDTIDIEFIILSKNNNIPHANFIISVNGKITSWDYNEKYTLPDLPNFCNAHYFYLSKFLFPSTKFDSYSLNTFGKNPISIKIFLSDKFDNFNNTVCECDEAEREKAVKFIDLQFSKRRTAN